MLAWLILKQNHPYSLWLLTIFISFTVTTLPFCSAWDQAVVRNCLRRFSSSNSILIQFFTQRHDKTSWAECDFLGRANPSADFFPANSLRSLKNYWNKQKWPNISSISSIKQSYKNGITQHVGSAETAKVSTVLFKSG